MVREFKEYRPWKTKQQFEKEISKYVGAEGSRAPLAIRRHQVTAVGARNTADHFARLKLAALSPAPLLIDLRPAEEFARLANSRRGSSRSVGSEPRSTPVTHRCARSCG